MEISQEAEYVFSATLKNAKTVLHLLQSIDLQDFAVVIISEHGIRFTIEKNRQFQVSSFLQKELFQAFRLLQPAVSFKVNIRQLIYTLSAMIESNEKETGGSSLSHTMLAEQGAAAHAASLDDSLLDVVSMKMLYREYGSPLILVFNYDGSTATICREMTQEPGNMLLFEIAPSSTISKVIVQSDFLKEVWNDLDLTSDHMRLTLDENEGLTFATKSQYGAIESSIGSKSEMVSQFRCEGVQTNSYPMAIVKCGLKALGQSSKTSLRTNRDGLLSIQYMLNMTEETKCFVEFFCLPTLDT